jgi:hypothetical protein
VLGDHLEDHPERELWARLTACLAEAPVVTRLDEPAEPAATQAAQARIARTARDVNAFADRLCLVFTLDGAAPAGSTRAIAWAIVNLCRVFTRHWAGVAEVTRSRAIEFNRDVALLGSVLRDARSEVERHDQQFG